MIQKNQTAGCLFAFDIDGTVSDALQPVRSAVLDAFRDAHSCGCTLSIVTGRSLHMLPPELLACPDVEYAIVANGARVCSRDGTVDYREAFLEDTLAASILEHCHRYGGSADIQFADVVAMERQYVAHMVECGKLPLPPHMRVGNEWVEQAVVVEDCTAILGDGHHVEKMILALPNTLDSGVYGEQLNREFRVNTAKIDGNRLEVSDAAANKGLALSFLAERLGIPRNRVAAIGDSCNDLSLRHAAGTFIAMGNAVPELLRQADTITESVREDGAAKALYRWLSNMDIL